MSSRIRIPRCPPIAHGFAIILIFLGGIGYPLFKGTATSVGITLLIVLYGSVWLGRGAWLERVDVWIRKHESAQKALLVFGSVVVAFGGMEYLARFLVQTELVEIYSPMLTQLPPGTEDWRRAHITADKYREPDPVLWWRPIAGRPYNRQRMKGPEVDLEKPPNVFRILCYGDSNTDGPDAGAWAERLQPLLEGASQNVRFEVLNAGVVGYTSHQGLLRFRQQVETFEPDLVLVSFGWNDLATALGAPDRSFEPPPAAQVPVERFLLHYRFYLIAKRYLIRRTPAASSEVVGHRVPLDDYLKNMERFRMTAQQHGVEIVFLTRPHRESTESLRRIADNWRARVPEYNDALRRFGEQTGAHVLDAQREFELHDPDGFIDECHFTEEGHQRMATFLASRLVSNGLLVRSDPRIRK